MNIYPEENLEALAKFLNIEVTDIHVWSDESLTIGDQDNIEYYVTVDRCTDHEFMGNQDGFNIYKCVQF